MIHNVKRELLTHNEKMAEEIDNLRQQLDEEFNKKIDKAEYIEFKATQMKLLEQKTDLTEVQSALNACQSDIFNRFLEYKEEIKGSTRAHENEIFNLLSKKANLTDIHKALKSKISQEDLTKLIQKKASLQEIIDLEKKLDAAIDFIDKKVNL